MERAKEQDGQLAEASSAIEQLQKALRESQQSEMELAERVQLAESAFETQDQEMQGKDEQIHDLKETLEKNRDLILMLKDEYKKVSDKEKATANSNVQAKEKEHALNT